MPARYRTREQIHELLTDAGLLNLLAAFFFEDSDSEDELDTDEEEFSEDEDFSVAELLELNAINWFGIADSFYKQGPGSRGPYNQIPKSKDFFSCCLQAPDREFRHMFRYARCPDTAVQGL